MGLVGEVIDHGHDQAVQFGGHEGELVLHRNVDACDVLERIGARVIVRCGGACGRIVVDLLHEPEGDLAPLYGVGAQRIDNQTVLHHGEGSGVRARVEQLVEIVIEVEAQDRVLPGQELNLLAPQPVLGRLAVVGVQNQRLG
ncbi:MAG: hypothetical protein LUE27_00460, partial [Clostridia bacterium]|nr:hypothetical protein [Clostridia bacterium]